MTTRAEVVCWGAQPVSARPVAVQGLPPQVAVLDVDMPGVNGVDLVASTTDPALAIDENGIVRSWNAGAEEVFGLTAAEACGLPCWRVLQGSDDYGNDYCSRTCQLRRMALSGKPVHRCHLAQSVQLE